MMFLADQYFGIPTVDILLFTGFVYTILYWRIATWLEVRRVERSFR